MILIQVKYTKFFSTFYAGTYAGTTNTGSVTPRIHSSPKNSKKLGKSQIIEKHDKQSKGKHTSLRLRDHLMPAVPWHMASVTIASPLFILIRELSWVHIVAVSQIFIELFMMFFMVI